MIKPSTNAAFCYVESCHTLSPYEVVTFQSDLFLLCVPLTAILSLSTHVKNSNSDFSIHLVRYSSTRSKTYFSPSCSLNLSTYMVFPNKYSAHTSNFHKFPQYSFAKGGMEISRERERGSAGAIEKKTQELHVSSVSRGSSIQK